MGTSMIKYNFYLPIPSLKRIRSRLRNPHPFKRSRFVYIYIYRVLRA